MIKYIIVLLIATLRLAGAGVDQVSFSFFKAGWMFRVQENGRLDAQFGSNAFDHAYLDEGSVDFSLLSKIINSIPTCPTTIDARAEVGVSGSENMRVIVDDTLLRYLVLSKTNQWRYFPGLEASRFKDLLRRLESPYKPLETAP